MAITGTKVGTTYLDVQANTAPYKKGLQGLGSVAGKLGKVIGSAFAVASLTKFGASCVSLASDLNEVNNVTGKAFAGMGKQVDEWAKNAVNAYGLSETMAKSYAGTFGAMAGSFGFTTKEAFKMSTTLAGLSGDVASFYNTSQDEAFTKLKSVFTGETESLKGLGVVMTQTALNQYAMANGFGKTVQQMTEAEKVSLRYSFVLNQLKFAQGDFAQTLGSSWANQIRVLQLNFQSLKATIGQSLMAVLMPVVKLINTILSALTVLAQKFNNVFSAITGLKLDDSSAQITADLGDAGSSADGLSDSLGNTGNNAKDTTKQIKELKRQMMGFDKINKLEANNTPIGGNVGGGGGGIGGGGVGGVDTAGVGKAGKELSKIKIPKALLDSVNRLKSAFTELAKVLGGAFKWVWQNILVPLGKWAIKEVAPRLIDILADAFRIITGVLKALAPVWQWIWEHLFKPLAKFAGKAVVGMLDGISGAFRLLADFVEKHPKLTAGLVTGLGALFALRKPATIFVTALANGGLLGVLKRLKMTKIGTALGKVFKLIKGHPIVAIVVALALAIGYVYKNWNKIKKTKIGKALINVGNKLKALGEKLKPLMDKLNDLKDKVLKKLSDAFDKLEPAIATIVEGVGTFLVDAFSMAIDVVSDLVDWVSNLVDWFSENLPKAGEKAKEILDKISGAWDSIKSGTKQLVAEAKEKVQGALDTLKEKWQGIKDKTAELKASIASKWADLKDKWHNIVDNVADKVADMKASVATKWSDIKERWHRITDNIKTKTADMKAKIATRWHDIKQRWYNITENIKNKTADMKAKVGSKWADLKGKWESLVSHFKDKTAEIKLKFSALGQDLKNWINTNVIDRINNHIPATLKKIGLQIPRLAQGGFVARNTPQLAVIGDNTHEGEIVAPESKLQAMADRASQNGGTDPQVIALLNAILTAIGDIDTNAYIDGKKITDVIVKQINQNTRATGVLAIEV